MAHDFNKEGCSYGRLTRFYIWAATAIIAPLVLTLIGTIIGTASRVTTIEALLQEVNHRLERIEKNLDKN